MVIACLLSGLAVGEPLMDLHDIAVGMKAQELPATGYRNFTCAAGRPIAGWAAWSTCLVDGVDGLRAVRVAYDEPGGETKVAGHPVDLVLYFDGSSRLTKIDIRTDDRAPPFLRKKAYILASQAKAHYGEDGWTCKSVPASQYEEPFGPLYVNEACSKLSPERRIEVSNRLFRMKEAAPRSFISDTKVSISMVPAGSK